MVTLEDNMLIICPNEEKLKILKQLEQEEKTQTEVLNNIIDFTYLFIINDIYLEIKLHIKSYISARRRIQVVRSFIRVRVVKILRP